MSDNAESSVSLLCISKLFMFSFTIAISAVFFNTIFSKLEKWSFRLLMVLSSSISEQSFLGLGLWRGEAGNGVHNLV